MIPSIYLNLEDDVARIVSRIKREKSPQLVLVCPKRCFLFNDSINLKLLKKQADLLGKEIFILTMDEKGQMYAKDAGFKLKFLPKPNRPGAISDIKPAGSKKPVVQPEERHENPIVHTVKGIKNFTKVFSKPEDNLPAREPKAIKIPPAKATQVKVPRVSDAGQKPKIKVSEAFFPAEIEQAYKANKRKSSNAKIIVAFSILSLLIILTVVFVILPKASVVIFPKTEPVTRDTEVSISSNVKSPDPSRLVMPATKISKEMEVSSSFQSQGKKEVGSKASGTVQIYNFTKQPLNLKAGTTVLLVGSKSYALAKDVTLLKPTVYKNAKTKEVDESSLSEPVEITATGGGESYNLPAGTRLEITNQVFGSKPQFLYAKTATPITGGVSRYLSVVSDQDSVNSQKTLSDKIFKDLQGDLAKGNLILADKSFTIEPVQFSTDKPVGTESPNFQATLKAKVTGLAFNSADLKKLVADRVSQTLSSNKKLEPVDDKQISYKIKTIDLNNELAVLSVHFEGKAVMDVVLDDVTPTLAGKSQDQVNEILMSKAEVDRIEVTLAPAWQKNFPWFARKINVRIEDLSLGQ